MQDEIVAHVARALEIQLNAVDPRRRGDRVARAPSDLDIAQTARFWIQQHGDEATVKARDGREDAPPG
jgi:hypothetical protein